MIIGKQERERLAGEYPKITHTSAKLLDELIRTAGNLGWSNSQGTNDEVASDKTTFEKAKKLMIRRILRIESSVKFQKIKLVNERKLRHGGGLLL